MCTTNGTSAFSKSGTPAVSGHAQSFVLFIVVTIAKSCALLFLTTKQKSDYLHLCDYFAFENCLDASANYKSNNMYSKLDGFLSRHVQRKFLHVIDLFAIFL